MHCRSRRPDVDAMTAAYALLIALALLQALDAWTTWRILGAGGRELNPVMRWVMAQIGVVPALVVKGVGVAVIGWVVFVPWPWVLGGVVLFYVGVVVFNFRSIK